MKQLASVLVLANVLAAAGEMRRIESPDPRLEGCYRRQRASIRGPFAHPLAAPITERPAGSSEGIYDLAAGCYTVVTTDQLLAVQRVLWVLGLSAQGLLIVAILQRKLLRAYPFFMAYLVIDLGFSLALIQIPFYTPAYAAAFRIYRGL